MSQAASQTSPVKLIAFDLDGTLLTTDKRLTRENLLALTRAAELGIELVPATGRFYGAIPESVRSLPFLHYAIAINGAQIYDVRTGRPVFRAELSWQRAVEVMEYLDTLPVIYDCYMDDWGWMSQAHYDRAADYAPHRHSLEMLQKLRSPVPELKAHLAQVRHGVQKVQSFFLDPALRLRSMEELARRFPDLAITSSIPRNVEINLKEAQKGLALTRLAELLGIERAGTAAFGDDLNDLTMLRAAGIGVAMANAAPELKAAADRITASCDESGVARGIEELIFQKEGSL